MWYDVLVVGVLLFAVIRGAMKGIVWQLATIAALVLCFAFSNRLSSEIAPYIAVQPPLNRWLAMFGLYLFFSFISFGAARVLRGWIEKAQFVEYDRHLGAVFGLVKGAVFVLVMTFFGVTLSHHYPEIRSAIFNSQTGKISAVVMDRLDPVMPKELHAVLEPYIHQLDRPGLDLKHAHGDLNGPSVNVFSADDQATANDLPPFPAAPRRIDDEPPPFDNVTDRRPGGSSPLDMFKSSVPVPNNPALPERSPIRPPAGARESTDLGAAREKMLREVASVLKSATGDQQGIVNQIENSLAGLPDQVKNAVVKDWYTDLLVYDRSQDPDPKTDLTTPFDARILRQLDLKNVPLSSLSSALRDRLQNVRR